jgi:succinate dehydrogenase (ubiquinone) cytochrome b560 subunit
VAAVAAWPLWAKASAKFAVAMPFFFHSVNGLRHLAWDFGVGFKNPTVAKTGWAAVGATFALSVYYSFFS